MFRTVSAEPLRRMILAAGLGLSSLVPGPAQPFYFGADLSYVHEMEDCGATYQSATTSDPYVMMAEHGCNLVRLRLWHTPAWYDGINSGHRYSDEADVRLSIQRARDEGMQVLLDFHLSDNWADPAHQVAPAAWQPILDDLPVLQDSLYQYIHGTLSRLAEDGLLPDIVQIGNETNKGILQSPEDNMTWQLDWARNTPLFNTAIGAVRDVSLQYSQAIRVAIHIAGRSSLHWLANEFWTHDVRDFDIIGLSWYYDYHGGTFADVGQDIAQLRTNYPGKDVMIFETAYPYTTVNLDPATNLLSKSYPGYSPFTPARQRDFMIALTQEVIDRGGIGVVYWEPAWVSTTCSTQWAQGSHWDNATYFDADDRLILPGGVEWMSHAYSGLSALLDPAAHAFTVTWTGDAFRIALTGDPPPSHIVIQLSRTDGTVWDRQRIIPVDDSFVLNPDRSLSPGIYLVSVRRGDGHVVTARVPVFP